MFRLGAETYKGIITRKSGQGCMEKSMWDYFGMRDGWEDSERDEMCKVTWCSMRVWTIAQSVLRLLYG